MDVSHIGEISHSRRYAPQHPHQLDDCELAVVFLRGTEGEKKKKPGGSAMFTDHEGNVGHGAAAAIAQDLWCLCAAQILLQSARCLGHFPANAQKVRKKDAALNLLCLEGDTYPEESV